MDQDRRDAQAWAMEWQIRQKRKKVIMALVGIIAVVAVGFLFHFVNIRTTRTVFNSEEEMRAALQGRYESDYFQDIEIMGDDVTNTYYEISHYDLEYAKTYGYYDGEDSVFEDQVVEWDYRHGVIKMRWMDEITVDKDGNITYLSTTLKKSDAPKPEPFDKALLNESASSGDTDISTDSELLEEKDAAEEQQDSLDQTEQAELAGKANANETEDNKDGNN